GRGPVIVLLDSRTAIDRLQHWGIGSGQSLVLQAYEAAKALVTNQQNEALSNTATQDETLPRKIDRIRHTRSRDLGRSIDKISRGVQQGPWKGGPVWTTRRRSNRDRRKEGDGGPKQKL
ncbi:hypothetical protein T310_7057, partial [Rasamsonia emersonii CBS 393.64]